MGGLVGPQMSTSNAKLTIRTEEKVCTTASHSKPQEVKAKVQEVKTKAQEVKTTKAAVQYESKCPHGEHFYACPCCS